MQAAFCSMHYLDCTGARCTAAVDTAAIDCLKMRALLRQLSNAFHMPWLQPRVHHLSGQQICHAACAPLDRGGAGTQTKPPQRASLPRAVQRGFRPAYGASTGWRHARWLHGVGHNSEPKSRYSLSMPVKNVIHIKQGQTPTFQKGQLG